MSDSSPRQLYLEPVIQYELEILLSENKHLSQKLKDLIDENQKIRVQMEMISKMLGYDLVAG